MRDIVLARLDKTRPAVVLTRDAVHDVLADITVAPITSTIKGVSTEVPLGRRNGLDHDCVASCDNVTTVRKDQVIQHLGYLFDDQEAALAEAITHAFDLWLPGM